MKAYTEPKLEIVTLNVSDVITTSAVTFSSLFNLGTGIESATSIDSFAIGN